MFKKIIIATDLSEASYTLINGIGGLKAFGAQECLLLQCMSFQQTASMALSYDVSDLEENLLAQKEILEKQGFKVETRVLPGVTKKEVNRIAISEDFSLIVVGAQKESMLSETFFGGLAYDVIHHSQKPVLIMRMAEKEKDKETPISTIKCDISSHLLFPTDFSENAERTFKYVEQMVCQGTGKVTLVHIQDKDKLYPYLDSQLDEFKSIDRERLENMKYRLIAKGNAEINIVLSLGNPAMEIIKLINEVDAQLVVMGSQGRGFVKELFLGSVSHKVARNSDASVLLIPVSRI